MVPLYKSIRKGLSKINLVNRDVKFKVLSFYLFTAIC